MELPMTTEGMLPRTAMVFGRKDKAKNPRLIGIKVNLEATPLAIITPGLKKKFTAPMTPRKPDSTLTNPVTATPLVIRLGILSGLRSSSTA